MNSIIDNILRRIKIILGIGTVRAGGQRSVSVDFADGELKKKIEFAQGYGLEVYPLAGSKAVSVFNSGDRAQGVVVAIADRRYTQIIQPGDVMLYDFRGQYVLLSEAGIEIKSTGNINLISDSGVNSNKTITTPQDVVAGSISLIGHTHTGVHGQTSPPN